nr:hypothetical protein [bacterium]
KWIFMERAPTTSLPEGSNFFNIPSRRSIIPIIVFSAITLLVIQIIRICFTSSPKKAVKPIAYKKTSPRKKKVDPELAAKLTRVKARYLDRHLPLASHHLAACFGVQLPPTRTFPAQPMCQIETFSGAKVHSIKWNPSTTILTLKKGIEGYDAHHTRLFYEGRELLDEETLGSLKGVDPTKQITLQIGINSYITQEVFDARREDPSLPLYSSVLNGRRVQLFIEHFPERAEEGMKIPCRMVWKDEAEEEREGTICGEYFDPTLVYDGSKYIPQVECYTYEKIGKDKIFAYFKNSTCFTSWCHMEIPGQLQGNKGNLVLHLKHAFGNCSNYFLDTGITGMEFQEEDRDECIDGWGETPAKERIIQMMLAGKISMNWTYTTRTF